LRLEVSEFFQVGIVVQVRLKSTCILGEVKYCVLNGETFFVGLQIQDVVWTTHSLSDDLP
jgi:hypothetical protein